MIGGGVAGLQAALTASEADGGEPLDIIVTTKASSHQSNTAWAQGGIAAVADAEDSVGEHIQDTLQAGADLCDPDVVAAVVAGGTEAVRRLRDWGMPLDLLEPGMEAPRLPGLEGLALGREGGHGRHRVLHAHGDATGAALSRTLVERVKTRPGIRHFDDCFVLDLLTTEGDRPRVAGAITHHPRFGLQVVWASAVVLATGGLGQVFRESTNPVAATGDGIAMAWRAGASLQDLALVQFHPTTLYVAGASRSLITEAVRGEGAWLTDRHGERFMTRYDPRAELAPRDIVSRSILDHLARTGDTHVFLDISPMGTTRFQERFPGIARLLERFELRPGAPIPVHPSAHYAIGGVHADTDGTTDLPGLFAVGEVSCTGLHGANRLASNSLLEGLVLGERAGRAAALRAASSGPPTPLKLVSDIRPSDRIELDLADVRSSLRAVMWRHVGILRDGDHLREVNEMFDFWSRYTLDKIFDDSRGWEVQNLLTAGALITRSAHWRAESRGVHHRVDAPEPDDDFRVHDLWKRGPVGGLDHPHRLQPVRPAAQATPLH